MTRQSAISMLVTKLDIYELEELAQAYPQIAEDLKWEAGRIAVKKQAEEVLYQLQKGDEDLYFEALELCDSDGTETSDDEMVEMIEHLIETREEYAPGRLEYRILHAGERA